MQPLNQSTNSTIAPNMASPASPAQANMLKKPATAILSRSKSAATSAFRSGGKNARKKRGSVDLGASNTTPAVSPQPPPQQQTTAATLGIPSLQLEPADNNGPRQQRRFPLWKGRGANKSTPSTPQNSGELLGMQQFGSPAKISPRSFPTDSQPPLDKWDGLRWDTHGIVDIDQLFAVAGRWAPYTPLFSFSQITTIGKGTTAHVAHAVLQQGVPMQQTEFAVKQLKASYVKNNLRAVKREVAIACLSPHQNIVQFFGAIEARNHDICLVFEFLGGGSLSNFLSVHSPLSERVIAYVLRGVLSALAFLHARNRIHRDVKPQNVLFGKQGEVKLGDLGLATQLKSTHTAVVGTPLWMAPEVVGSKPYTDVADIWSIGIISIEMAQSAPPNDGLNALGVMHNIEFQNAPRLAKPENWSKEFVSFVHDGCLQKDPLNRSSASDLLQHPFLDPSRCERTNKIKEMVEWASLQQ